MSQYGFLVSEHRAASAIRRRFAAYALSRLGTETAPIQLGEMAGNDPEPSVRAAPVNSLDRKQ
jgi:hypothetical protein